MSTPETKNDEILQSEVLDALRKIPTIPAAHIGVSATGGAITLTGDVETVNERFEAVEAAQSVDGVLAVADEIQVRGFGDRDRTDTDIAVDIARILSSIAPGLGLVTVDVVDNVVLLSGQVPLVRDRDAAEQAASAIVGVRNVINHVSVGPPAAQEEVEQEIFEVFVNQAGEHARAIEVEIDDGQVLLKGNVPTLAHKTLAERAAYAVPGVRKVVNHLHMHT
jgi:osmotically-inducible protein OsmY